MIDYAKYPKVSDRCNKYHMQYCDCCDDLSCGDNDNDTLKELVMLRGRCQELEALLKTELKNACYLAECMLDGSKDEAAVGVCLSAWEKMLAKLEGREP